MFQSNAFEVRDLGRVILRRRGAMLASVLGFLGLAFALNTLTRPVFRTAARLEIQPTVSRSPLTGAAIETPTPASENLALLTTAERIMRRDVLERVVLDVRSRGIALAPAPDQVMAGGARGRASGPSAAGWFVRMAGAATPAPTDSMLSAQARMAADVDWLQKAASVRPIRDTRLVDVQVEHWSPRAAADIANTLAKEFVRGEAENRRAEDRDRLASLRDQASDVRRVIQSSENRLYGSKSSGLALANERSKQLAQSGIELSSGVLKARSDLHVIDKQLARIAAFRSASAPDWSNPPVQTPAMDELYRELQRTETDILAQRRIYREGSQELAPLEAQITALRDAMRRELQKAYSDLETQRDALSARVGEQEQAINHNEWSIKTLSDSSYKYSTLESELGTQRDLYTLLLKKVQEQDIAQTIMPATVDVVQAATVPMESVRPRRVVNLAVGLLLGLVFGTGLALALEAVRRTIRTPRDVVQLLQLPVMGMIPRRM